MRMKTLRVICLYALLVLVAFTTIAPLIWMLFTSFHPPLSPIPTPRELFHPKHWAFGNYWYVLTFAELPVARFALNSILVTTAVVVFQLTICSLAAYAFARLSFRGRDTLFFLLMLTMMIPATVMIVPLFITVHKLGLLNS
jgi:multiple sugar transport system permease protein